MTAPHCNPVNWSYCDECVMRPVAESLSECLGVCVRVPGNATAMTDTLLCPSLERCGLPALSLPNGVKLDYVNWAERGMHRLHWYHAIMHGVHWCTMCSSVLQCGVVQCGVVKFSVVQCGVVQ